MVFSTIRDDDVFRTHTAIVMDSERVSPVVPLKELIEFFHR